MLIRTIEGGKSLAHVQTLCPPHACSFFVSVHPFGEFFLSQPLIIVFSKVEENPSD